MKVLQLLPELNVGGVETGVIDLAVALQARGHEPHVMSNGGALVARLETLGIPHVPLPVHRKSLIHMLRLVPKVTRYIRTHGIEIVHARSRVPGWIGYWACRITGAVFITTCHGYYAEHLASRVMGWGQLVIVPSHMIGRHMIEDFGVPAEHIRLVHRGVDVAAFTYRELAPQPPKTFRIGMIGRLTPLKGHLIILKAALRLTRLMPHVKFVIAGEPPRGKESFLEELHMWVRRFGVTRSVEFTGTCADVPALLRTLDLVVVPSTQPESFGRVAIEAQAAGVPVIASRIGGLAEIIEDGQTGLLVSPGDHVELANAMARLLGDRALARRLTARARAVVEERFTLAQMVERTCAVYDEVLKTTRILVIKLSALGDLILISPSLRAIRRQYPHARIHCLVGLPARTIVQRCPYIDEVFVDDARAKDRGWRGAWRVGRRLRRHGFDIVLDLQSSRRSRLIGWATGAAARHGYANGKWSWLLTHRVPNTEPNLPPVRHQHQLLTAVGIAPDGEQLEYWPGPEDDAEARRLLRQEWLSPQQPLVAIHPGGSAAWDTKRWSVERWATLCDALARHRVRTILTGTADERALGEAIQRAARSKPILVMGKTSLGGLACLFRRCRAVVTLDTASLHLAAAVGTPAVALFGPTDPQRHAPPAEQLTVLWKHLPCSPCYQRHCPLPGHKHLQCMTKITADEVIAAVEAFVEQSARAHQETATAS